MSSLNAFHCSVMLILANAMSPFPNYLLEIYCSLSNELVIYVSFSSHLGAKLEV